MREAAGYGSSTRHVDQQGNIYVADDTDDAIKKVAATGQALAAWGGTGSAPGQLSGNSGVGGDAKRNVYVSEFYNCRVQKFSPMGKVLAVLGSTGPSVQQLNHPIGVAVDAQGNLYVNDHRNNRIVKFSSAGKFLAAWVPLGSPAGLFILPEGIAVDAQGYIYVAANHHLFNLAPAGKVLTIWDKSPYGIGDLAVDSQGNLYAEADGAPDRLEKLSLTGKTLTTWQALCTAG